MNDVADELGVKAINFMTPRNGRFTINEVVGENGVFYTIGGFLYRKISLVYHVFWELRSLFQFKKEQLGLTKNSFPISLSNSFKFINTVDYGFEKFVEKQSTRILNVGPLIETEIKIEDSDKQLLDVLNKKENVIFVSFGTTGAVSTGILKNIVSISKKREETFIVSIKDEMRKSLGIESTENVYFYNWVNQRMILNHSSTRLFISHGGISSIYETMHFQVPIIVITDLFERVRNAVLVQFFGIGEFIQPKNNITSLEKLDETINKILSNRSEYLSKLKTIKELNELNDGKGKAMRFIKTFLKIDQFYYDEPLTSQFKIIDFLMIFIIIFIIFLFICSCCCLCFVNCCYGCLFRKKKIVMKTGKTKIKKD